MSRNGSARSIVERQLLAYNTRDVDAYCALFAQDAALLRLEHGEFEELARGVDAIRAYYTERFKNPRLHCEIKARIELGNFVVDHECVRGIGERALEVIAIYEVRDTLIRSVRLIWPQ